MHLYRSISRCSSPTFLISYDDGKFETTTEAMVLRALMPQVPVKHELLGKRVRKYFKKYRAFFEGVVASYE